MQYSSGNWEIRKNSSWGLHNPVGDQPGYVICHNLDGRRACLACVAPYLGMKKEEAEGNARIVAAAPKMYEAIKSMLAHQGNDLQEWKDVGLHMFKRIIKEIEESEIS